jgi:hypothetical protein
LTAFDALVGLNYRPDDVWKMTPRQIGVALAAGEKRRRRHAAETLAFNTLAARGEPREVEKQMKLLQE